MVWKWERIGRRILKIDVHAFTAGPAPRDPDQTDAPIHRGHFAAAEAEIPRQVPWAASHIEDERRRTDPAGDCLKKEFSEVSAELGLRAGSQFSSVVTRAELKDQPLQKVTRGLPGWGQDRYGSFAGRFSSCQLDAFTTLKASQGAEQLQAGSSTGIEVRRIGGLFRFHNKRVTTSARQGHLLRLLRADGRSVLMIQHTY